MKHVDDAFWQRFAPAIQNYASSQGIDDFYMFGEVAEDFSHELLSHYTTHDDVQGVLDFLFQVSAVRLRGQVAADRPAARLLRRRRLVHRRRLQRLQPADVPRQPRPRAHRHVPAQRQPGRERGGAAAARSARARADVLLARQPRRLLRRRAGLHRRRRRPGRAPGHVPLARPEYDNLTTRHDDGAAKRQHRLRRDADGRQLRSRPPALPGLAQLAAVTRRHPALRDGAQQHRFSSSGAGVYAFSRIGRDARVRRRARTTRRRRRSARSRPTSPTASGTRSTATAPTGSAAAATGG